MQTAKEIAQYIICVSDLVGAEPVTPLRLQKLLYFCQAVHLKRHNQPLFNEDFVRWDYGPVIKDIYNDYKKYERNVIDVERQLDSFNLTRDEESTVIDTLRAFNDDSTAKLVNITHDISSPWNYGEANTIITKNSIKDMPLRKVLTTDQIVDSLEVDGYTDQNGYLILGAE